MQLHQHSTLVPPTRSVLHHARSPYLPRTDSHSCLLATTQVLDARDPEGTRCRFLEHHIRNNARHKHLLFLLNKCDMVRGPA
jgi:hypothetical protein